MKPEILVMQAAHILAELDRYVPRVKRHAADEPIIH